MARRKAAPKPVDLSVPVVTVEHDDDGYRPVWSIGGIAHDTSAERFESEAAARKAGLAAVEHLS